MSEGIRIRHKTLRVECTVAVRDMTERLKSTSGEALPDNYPYPGCAVCSLPSPGHDGYKTRHVDIDSDGYGIVSAGVLDGLKKLGDLGGFDIENVVSTGWMTATLPSGETT